MRFEDAPPDTALPSLLTYLRDDFLGRAVSRSGRGARSVPESVLLWPVVCSSSVHELSELEESEPCTRFFCGFTPGFSFPMGAFKSSLLSRRLKVISC